MAARIVINAASRGRRTDCRSTSLGHHYTYLYFSFIIKKIFWVISPFLKQSPLRVGTSVETLRKYKIHQVKKN